MESICNFSPLWQDNDMITRPQSAIEEVRTIALKRALEHACSNLPAVPSINEILALCKHIITDLTNDLQVGNCITQRLRELSDEHDVEPLQLIEEAMAVWYISATPVLTRDSHQGMPPDSEIETDADGNIILTWSREYAAEQYRIANLGLMAMLMTAESWVPPTHSALRTASLVSNATATILFAAYIISCRKNSTSWDNASSLYEDDEPSKLFLRTAWQITREGQRDNPPGAEFGATMDEIKLSPDGNKLLTKIGRDSWQEASYWHPCKKTPGSSWTKFLRNFSQPFFGATPSEPSSIVYKLPSSSVALIHPWETYYSTLRSKFDSTGRHRTILGDEEQLKQHKNLSASSGAPYPTEKPSEATAAYTTSVEQEYLYNFPMVKKPITDLHGQLTLPFMTTATRAMRFEDEPDEAEMDLFIMSFEWQSKRDDLNETINSFHGFT